jgi:hypothetical protein
MSSSLVLKSFSNKEKYTQKLTVNLGLFSLLKLKKISILTIELRKSIE